MAGISSISSTNMFNPKPLKYGYGNYSPAVSAEIMQVHYEKHYLTYIKNLNEALNTACPDFFKLELPEVLSRINEIPESVRTTVRNNGGGAINHEILWDTLSDKPTSIHDGQFKTDICKEFSTWDQFLELMANTGASLFGSGWVWLVLDKNTKKLSVTAYPNQDSPFMDGLYPVFGVDVWEHAYYLQYKNVRKEYIVNLLKMIDWNVVEQRYLEAIK